MTDNCVKWQKNHMQIAEPDIYVKQQAILSLILHFLNMR